MSKKIDTCFVVKLFAQTLCRSWTTSNLHRITTSWREELPRINLDTCLRKEHCGGFYVLNHWLFGLCNWCRLCKCEDDRAYKKNDAVGYWKSVPTVRTPGRIVATTSNSWLRWTERYTKNVHKKNSLHGKIGRNPERTKLKSWSWHLELNWREIYWQLAERCLNFGERIRSPSNVLEIFVVLTTLCGKVIHVAHGVKMCF